MRRAVSTFRRVHGLPSRSFAPQPTSTVPPAAEGGADGWRAATALVLVTSVGAVVGVVAYKPDAVREKLSLPALNALEPLIATIESATASLRPAPPAPRAPKKEAAPEPAPASEPETMPVHKEEAKPSIVEKKAGSPKEATKDAEAPAAVVAATLEAPMAEDKPLLKTPTSQVGCLFLNAPK